MSNKEGLQESGLLVVIDPAQETHIALDRAIITAKLRKDKDNPKLFLFFSIDEDSTSLSADNTFLYKNDNWFNEIINSVESEGIEYSFELCWSTNWYQAVLNYAERIKPDVILLPESESSKTKGSMANSKWALLRKSPCPVMIVRPNASSLRTKVLAAVNIQNQQEEYVALNEKILKNALLISKLYDAEFFVINAYPNSLNYPNREKIIKMTQLPSKNVHAEEGEPAEVVSAYAKEIGADLVVLGTMARTGARALMRGNTSEKVLKKLTQDVVTYS